MSGKRWRRQANRSTTLTKRRTGSRTGSASPLSSSARRSPNSSTRRSSCAVSAARHSTRPRRGHNLRGSPARGAPLSPHLPQRRRRRSPRSSAPGQRTPSRPYIRRRSPVLGRGDPVISLFSAAADLPVVLPLADALDTSRVGFLIDTADSPFAIRDWLSSLADGPALSVTCENLPVPSSATRPAAGSTSAACPQAPNRQHTDRGTPCPSSIQASARPSAPRCNTTSGSPTVRRRQAPTSRCRPATCLLPPPTRTPSRG
ncbi:protein of unknown function [Streptantibioticus cattleyicolor NRRL 8057 = DSM 46488]|nr:protein of unknown function [Streptantibioticus cattleyicolor NRRL 8057 = DSM 46488]